MECYTNDICRCFILEIRTLNTTKATTTTTTNTPPPPSPPSLLPPTLLPLLPPLPLQQASAAAATRFCQEEETAPMDPAFLLQYRWDSKREEKWESGMTTAPSPIPPGRWGRGVLAEGKFKDRQTAYHCIGWNERPDQTWVDATLEVFLWEKDWPWVDASQRHRT